MKQVDNNGKKTTDCDVEVLWNVDLSNDGIYLMTNIYIYIHVLNKLKSFWVTILSFINESDEIEK